MPANRLSTVVRDGITKMQPGTSVSTSSGYLNDGKVILNVRRHYAHLKNSFGGLGVTKKLDCDGLVFTNSDEAFAFALDRGYLDVFYRNRKIVRA